MGQTFCTDIDPADIVHIHIHILVCVLFSAPGGLKCVTHGFLEKFNVCTTKNSKHSRGSLHCWLRSRADKAAAVLSQTGSSCCCLFSLRLLTWARHLRCCPLRSGAKWHLEFLCTVYTGEPSHPLSHPLCTHRVSWRSAGASPSAHRAQAAKTPAPAHHSAHTHIHSHRVRVSNRPKLVCFWTVGANHSTWRKSQSQTRSLLLEDDKAKPL